MLSFSQGGHPRAVAAKKRVLGLIVGLGLGAGVFYYKRIARALEAGPNSGLMLAHADLRKVLNAVRSGDIASLAEYLNTMITGLANAGATLSAIAAVTPHICITQLTRSAAIPIISILDCVRAELEGGSVRRLALFGTRYVIESDMFGSLPNVDIVRPTGAEVSLIDGVYKGLAARGYGIAEDRETLNKVGLALCEREHVDVVLLAGTDLSMLFECEEPAFPSLDCSVVHIRAILGRLTGS
jgi:aspartate racemase